MGGSGSKKTATNNEDGNDKKDVRGSVKERHHPYEECHPEDDDNKADPGVEEQFKVARAPRQYEDIDKDFDQEKSETKDSSNSRLSQKQPEELNYVDVEFTKPKKKKTSKKPKDSYSSDVPPPSVEYSEVLIQNSKPNLK